MKNKLTITRGEQEGHMEEERKGHQGPCIEDPWTKPKRVGSRVGGGDGWYVGRCVV